MKKSFWKTVWNVLYHTIDTFLLLVRMMVSASGFLIVFPFQLIWCYLQYIFGKDKGSRGGGNPDNFSFPRM